MPKKAKRTRTRALYRQKPPKAGGRKPEIGNQNSGLRHPVSEFRPLPSSHFQLREDGSIQKIKVAQASGLSPFGVSPNEISEEVSGGTPDTTGGTPVPPALIFRSDSPFIRLYHGNCLELLDAIYARHGNAGRFDAIFADPPYFLSNGGISCHAGKMVKVDKGDWDKSRGAELNHEFNTEWLKRCQRVLKPNGTIWVSGTHHVIFSIGYAMQQLGYKILNDIAWEKPNPPPNLSCRYFTHSTETILWAAKNEKSKHVFNYQDMRKVTGKQMKTVWRKEEFGVAQASGLSSSDVSSDEITEDVFGGTPNITGGTPVPPSSIWTMTAPSGDEKAHGKHPTQKPVALIERCLLASTNENDLVLDPFLGGGTTAVAAIKLKRGCVGIELDFAHIALAVKRCEREIIEIVLRTLRVRIEVSVFSQNDLDLFSDSINGSRRMADVPQIETERIYHECKFVFLSCAEVARGSVVHTTVDVSLQEAWAKTPNGKKRETTHVVRCETEIFRIK